MNLYVLFFGTASRRVPLLIGLSKRRAGVIGALVSRWSRLALERSHGVFVSPNAMVSSTVKFPHPVGIVIGDGVVVEDDVVIFQHVTLGGAKIGDGAVNGYPSIGAGTVIYSGAQVLGPVVVGKGCVIGAGSIVLNSVLDGSTVVGTPGRVVRQMKHE